MTDRTCDTVILPSAREQADSPAHGAVSSRAFDAASPRGAFDAAPPRRSPGAEPWPAPRPVPLPAPSTSRSSRRRPAPGLRTGPDPTLWGRATSLDQELDRLVALAFQVSARSRTARSALSRCALRGAVIECAGAASLARRQPGPEAAARPLAAVGAALWSLRKVLYAAYYRGDMDSPGFDLLSVQCRRLTSALEQERRRMARCRHERQRAADLCTQIPACQRGLLERPAGPGSSDALGPNPRPASEPRGPFSPRLPAPGPPPPQPPQPPQPLRPPRPLRPLHEMPAGRPAERPTLGPAGMPTGRPH